METISHAKLMKAAHALMGRAIDTVEPSAAIVEAIGYLAEVLNHSDGAAMPHAGMRAKYASEAIARLSLIAEGKA